MQAFEIPNTVLLQVSINLISHLTDKPKILLQARREPVKSIFLVPMSHSFIFLPHLPHKSLGFYQSGQANTNTSVTMKDSKRTK